jgi:ferredoxin
MLIRNADYLLESVSSSGESQYGTKERSMRIVVDLNRCQSYGQCVFAAPTVFRFHGEEALEYDYAPDDELRTQVRRAAAACPVQAISIDYVDERPEVDDRRDIEGERP